MAFRFTLPVRFADVDHAGIVYYPTFFHYFHQTFEELFRDRLGPTGFRDLLDVDRVGMPVVHAEADFHAPLRLGDEVAVAVSLGRLSARSITLQYEARMVGSDQLSATGSVISVFIDLDSFQACPVPTGLRALFERL